MRANDSNSNFRSPFLNARRGTHNDTPEPVRHKLSDSHSSLSSYGSWQSRSHSRISSVTTVSGGHGLGSSSVTELPILESKLAELNESTRRQFYGDAKTPLSAVTRHPVPEAIENDQPERPGSPSDAVLNMKGPAKYRQNMRSPW